MTIDAAEIARLREIAEKATPGPWVVKCGEDGIGMTYFWVSPIGARLGTTLADEFESGPARVGGPTSRTAAHIAAFDPPTVLALLEELEKARKREEDDAVLIGKFRSGVAMQEIMRINNALIAERDAARSLLREVKTGLFPSSGAADGFIADATEIALAAYDDAYTAEYTATGATDNKSTAMKAAVEAVVHLCSMDQEAEIAATRAEAMLAEREAKGRLDTWKHIRGKSNPVGAAKAFAEDAIAALKRKGERDARVKPTRGPTRHVTTEEGNILRRAILASSKIIDEGTQR